jgi:hypothetical protein
VRGRLTTQLKPEYLLLGDESADWHHPYVRTAEPLEDRASYFKSMAWPMVRMEELGEAEAVLRPNYYDFVWLGSSADRFRTYVTVKGDQEKELTADELGKALQRARGGAGPILLDDLQARVVDLWETIRWSGISDSRLRNFEEFVTERSQAWRAEDSAEGRAAVDGLAGSLIRRYFPGCADEVLEAYEKGYLEWTLKLYLRVLKERIEKGAKKDGTAVQEQTVSGINAGPGARGNGGVPAGTGG